ncbi:hypothetical protein DPMN_006017 [Dreissena polymorpha]|uniref:Uncharacterized protein n=1 Tax=Dreissena polymorpha TaxID=45954 RepID=A0A9D4MUJ1_DREPO|nr:hypothetical protein DPMN_006017 [Dreissena polymorpha]
MLTPRFMKLHRYIDHDWQMTPIDVQVSRLKQITTATHRYHHHSHPPSHLPPCDHLPTYTHHQPSPPPTTTTTNHHFRPP